jgi:hypothetical protein
MQGLYSILAAMWLRPDLWLCAKCVRRRATCAAPLWPKAVNPAGTLHQVHGARAKSLQPQVI